MARGLISRTLGNLKNTSTSTTWSPSDPVPSGYTSTKATYDLTVSSLDRLSIGGVGSWAKGTILLDWEREQDSAASLGAVAEEEPRDEKDQRGTIKVIVERRWNSDTLNEDSRVEIVDKDWEAGLMVVTPSPTSRFSHLSHQLSFHITLLLPASLTSLSSLSISLNRFRILFSPRLARKEFEWGDIDIRTTDAPVAVADDDDSSEPTSSSERRSRSVSTSRVGSRSVSESPARLVRGDIHASSSTSSLQAPTVWANRLTIYNTNRLDPDTTSLKNYLPSLAGSFVTRNAGPIVVRVANGSIYANLRSDGGGPIQVATTNFTLEGKFEGGKIDVTNQNSPIVGSFITPVGSPSSSITIQNSVGKIEGSFASHSISLSTANAPIDGLFEVPSSGGSLTLKNVGWRIDGTIRLIQIPAGGVPASVAPPSSALSDSSSLHTVTSLPPAYSTTLTATKVLVETTDASVEIVYEGKGVIDSKVRTGRSHRALVKHLGGGYSGAFAASTSLMYNAIVDFNPTAAGRKVSYSVQKKHEIVGTIEGGEGSGSRTEVSAAGGIAEIHLE